MILLRIPPLTRGQDLRDDLALPPLLIHQLGDLLRDGLLLGIVIEDAGAVLAAAVGALPVYRRGVVHAVEEFEELAVG